MRDHQSTGSSAHHPPAGRGRRWAAALGVVLAAAASLATSQPEWRVQDSIGGLRADLSAETPEQARHFTVRSSEPHTLSVVGTIRWDDGFENPAGALRVRIANDEGDVLREEIARADESFEDGELQSRKFGVSTPLACPAESCEAAYTVTLTMVDGHPDETLSFDYSVEASFSGVGSDEPEDAFVTLTED